MPHFGWYYLTYSQAVIVIAGLSYGGWMLWLAPVWTFGFIPLLDHFRGIAKGNATPDQEKKYSTSIGYNAVVWLWVPIQSFVLVFAVFCILSADFSAAEFSGAVFSVGIMTGAIGITWAHELCHRTDRLEKALAEILLSQVSYAHFAIEHVYGHHRNVATPLDPATSRLGESFYRFLPRTVGGGLVSAWRIEKHQLAKKGRSVFDLRNRMLRYLLIQGLIYGGLAYMGGWILVLFFAGQAMIAITLLEIVNYLEHYGLLRQETGAGRYERVQPWHSWNASQIVSNLSLINLARHSDHHFMASRRYQILRHYDDVPQLPSGYPAMIIIALIPPLWFRLMNPRVQVWREMHLPA